MTAPTPRPRLIRGAAADTIAILALTAVAALACAGGVYTVMRLLGAG